MATCGWGALHILMSLNLCALSHKGLECIATTEVCSFGNFINTPIPRQLKFIAELVLDFVIYGAFKVFDICGDCSQVAANFLQFNCIGIVVVELVFQFPPLL